MKYCFCFLGLLLLMSLAETQAKEFKIYRCQMPDGTIVLQDAWCKPNQKIVKKSKSVPTKPNKNRKKNKKSSTRQSTATSKRIYRKPASITPLKTTGSELSTGRLAGFNIAVKHADHWQVGRKMIEQKMLHFDFSGGAGIDEFLFNLDFVTLPVGKKFSRDDLVVLLQSVSRWMTENPDLSRDWVFDMELQEGIGIYGTFENSGQGYQYNTKGYVYRSGFLIQFNVLSQRIDGTNFARALHVLSSGINVAKAR
ncbi:hypothetical protein [Marinicella sp. W31]|uniref:hypothetical protein n=1 Tax=Marinicella sp. W31 TaxID=3023713 RepID=UPI0037584108